MVAAPVSEELSTPPQQPAPRMRPEIEKLATCPSDIHDKAVLLLERWLAFSNPRNTSTNDDKSASAQLQFAACLLLVTHSAEVKAAAEGGKPSSGQGPSLRDIVTGYGTTCFEVFRNATRMLQSAAGQEWLQDLHDDQEKFSKSVKEIISRFLIVTITFKKLEKLYNEHCIISSQGADAEKTTNGTEASSEANDASETGEQAEKQPSSSLAGALEAGLDSLATLAAAAPPRLNNAATPGLQRDVLAFAWKLFLFVRVKAGLFDLLPGFYALLSCLHYVLSGGGDDFSASLSSKPEEVTEGSSLLAALCHCCQCELNKTLEKTHDLVTDIIATASKDGKLKGWSEGANSLSSKGNLAANLQLLSQELALTQPLLVDGLLPLDLPGSIGQSNSSEDAADTNSRPLSSFDNSLNLLRTPTKRPRDSSYGHPSPGAMDQTPVRKALGDVQFLRNYLDDETSEPGPALVEFFKACEPAHNPAQLVAQRIQKLPQNLVIEADARDMGIRLYLKSLRLILEREEERLGRKNFPEMLMDESMHKALQAICFEIVSRAHVLINLDFPTIPKAFNVCHMEFFVMIFNFLNVFESKLSKSVRSHLGSLQNKLLDYGVWQTDSPLWAHLEQDDMAKMWNQTLESCGSHPTVQQSSLSQSPMIVRVARSFGKPPMRPPAPASTPLSPVRGNAQASSGDAIKNVGPTQKQVMCVARKFWTRVYEVAYDLYCNLSHNGGMGARCFDLTLAVLKKIFMDTDARRLLQDRHLHQIIMCVIFGASKLEDETSVPFRRIIDVHSHIATSDKFMDLSEGLYWTVHIGPAADQKGNIIEFYNKKFVPLSKDMLLDSAQHLGASRGMATPPMSPQRPVKKMCVSPGVFTSPSRVTQLTFTPRTKRLATSEEASVGDAGFGEPRKRMRSEPSSSGPNSARRSIFGGASSIFGGASTPPRHPGRSPDRRAVPSTSTSAAEPDFNFGATSRTVSMNPPRPRPPVPTAKLDPPATS